MIEVEINSIRVSLMNQQRVILLKDLHDERYLPIWIGNFEAEAITLELRERRLLKRPMTHDLIKNVIENMGGTLKHIYINDMRKDVYYARLVVEMGDGSEIEIDSRPSDAIALAVRAKVGIFIDTVVMDKHGIEPEEEVDLGADTEADFGFDDMLDDVEDDYEEYSEEQLDKIDESQLSAFSDFVNSLDLEDLEDED